MTLRGWRRAAVPAVLTAILMVLAIGGSGCAARRRAQEKARILDPDTLYQMAIEDMERAKFITAKQYLERIQYTPQSRTQLEPLVRLALADAAFHAGDDVSLIDARAKYLDFVTLYAGHPRAPYAQLQAGVCSLKRAAQPTKDQTQTLVAITDFKEVLRRYPASPYARAAADRIRSAESRLAEHDFAVATFYFRRRSYLAAADRLRGLLKDYPRFQGKDRVYYYLGESLVRANNGNEGRLYLEKLIEDFPNCDYVGAARKSLARLNEQGAPESAPPGKG